MGWVPSERRALIAIVAVVLAVAPGCSSQAKKVSGGGGITDVLMYDVLGRQRSPTYYHEVLRDSHDRDRFCYRCTEDPFLIDKSIDAAQKLGDAQFARARGPGDRRGPAHRGAARRSVAVGTGQRRELAHQDGIEDSALRRKPGVPETGERFLRLVQEMDAMHPEGVRRPGEPARRRLLAILTEIGRFEIDDVVVAKNSLVPFSSRAYLIDESDPAVRTAIDTALSRRLRGLIHVALESAVQAPHAWTREEAIRGLKTLNDDGAQDAVLAQLEVETNWRVRSEAVEYLGRIGTPEAVQRLLPMLEDQETTIRHKSRQALVRIAGRDYGIRRRAWTRWAKSRYPNLELERETEEASDDDDAAAG